MVLTTIIDNQQRENALVSMEHIMKSIKTIHIY